MNRTWITNIKPNLIPNEEVVEFEVELYEDPIELKQSWVQLELRRNFLTRTIRRTYCNGYKIPFKNKLKYRLELYKVKWKMYKWKGEQYD